VRRELACKSEDPRGHVHSWGNEERIRCLSFKDLLSTMLGKAHQLSDAPRVDQNNFIQVVIRPIPFAKSCGAP
jgi:hypothetical protein